MGNTLEFCCPNCGALGQKPVSKTEIEGVSLSSPFGETLSGRRRDRRCTACRSKFYTLEVPERLIISLLAQARLGEQLRNRLILRGYDSDEGLIGKSENYLRMIWIVFKSDLLGFEKIYPLSSPERAFMIYTCEDIICELSLDEQRVIKNRFNLNHNGAGGDHDLSEFGDLTPEEEAILEKAMRKLRAPPRSSRLLTLGIC